MKYEKMMVSNNEYKIRVAIVESSLEEMDTLKVENYKCKAEIKRLEEACREGERAEQDVLRRYTSVVGELQEQSRTCSWLEF